jgi:type II secretory pathway pseudopilin PulG
MELLLALVVFGILGAICVYGYSSSSRASREMARGHTQERPMAGVSGE